MWTLEVGVLNRSPFQRRKTKNTSIILKKQVKFTDDLKCCADVITTILPESHQNNNHNGKMFIIDTLPGECCVKLVVCCVFCFVSRNVINPWSILDLHFGYDFKKQPQLLFNKYPICNQNVNHQFSTWSILEKDNKKTQIHVEIIFPIYFDSFYSHFLFRIQRKYNVLAWATKSKSWRWLKPTKIRNSVIEINKNKKRIMYK